MQPSTDMPVVGLIPAGGVAARLSPLPCSKELLPVGFLQTPAGPRPKPVCLYLLERMRAAGIERAFIVLRPGKWDIPAYLGDGAAHGVRLAYLTVHIPHGSPYTLDQALPFTAGCLVALGLPDIIFEPADAYAQLIARQRAGGADIVLGLFPTNQPQTADMVETEPDGQVRRIIIKPPRSELPYTWMIALWTPAFSAFMHQRLAEDLARRADPAAPPAREIFVGDLIQAAIDAGMAVDSVAFPAGNALDIGLPENLLTAVRTQQAAPPTHPPELPPSS